MSAYACPFCDYTAPLPNSVKGHITASADDDHQGESGPEFSPDDLLDGDEHPDYGGDPADTAEQDDDEPEQVADAGDDEQDSAPDSAEAGPETDDSPPSSAASTDGGAGIVPDSDAHTPSQSTSEGSTAEPEECPNPDCANTEHFRDADQHLEEYRDRLEPQHVEALEAGSHVCRACGGVF